MQTSLFWARLATAGVVLACLCGMALVAYLGPDASRGPSAYGYTGTRVASAADDL